MLRRVISVGRSAGGRFGLNIIVFFRHVFEHNSDSCCQILMKSRINTAQVYTKVHAKAQVHGYHMKGESGAGKVGHVEAFPRKF